MQLKFFAIIVFYLALTIITASCGKDEPLANLEPSITSNTAEADTIYAVANQSALIRITAIKGSAELNELEVRENNEKVDAGRIGFKGSNVGTNPVLLLASDRQSFNAEVRLRTLYADTVTILSVIIIDNEGRTDTLKRIVKAVKKGPDVVYSGSDPVNTAMPGTSQSFRFSAAPQSAGIDKVLVKENGVIMTDVSRLRFDGKPFETNPYVIPSNLTEGFSGKELSVTMPNTTGKWTYSFTWFDLLGGKTEKVITVYVGSKLEFTKNGILQNAAGPQGSGGLDLDKGEGTAFDSDAAEIRDEGIDDIFPPAANWKQKIAAVNGAELRRVVQIIDISDIVVKEQILKYWDQGVPVTGATPNKVLLGDIFVVKRADRYYFIQVSKVSITQADNSDNYIFDIKY